MVLGMLIAATGDECMTKNPKIPIFKTTTISKLFLSFFIANQAAFFGYMGIAAALVFCSKIRNPIFSWPSIC